MKPCSICYISGEKSIFNSLQKQKKLLSNNCYFLKQCLNRINDYDSRRVHIEIDTEKRVPNSIVKKYYQFHTNYVCEFSLHFLYDRKVLFCYNEVKRNR